MRAFRSCRLSKCMSQTGVNQVLHRQTIAWPPNLPESLTAKVAIRIRTQKKPKRFLPSYAVELTFFSFVVTFCFLSVKTQNVAIGVDT
jgi:hypothetical protein